jgi:2-keto-3-deoxy-6-phosphogluconate aldolase
MKNIYTKPSAAGFALEHRCIAISRNPRDKELLRIVGALKNAGSKFSVSPHCNIALIKAQQDD